jgi:hypothetical protein
VPTDVPVFAVFNASRHVRLPDKIDHALHCPVALRLTATALEFKQLEVTPAPDGTAPMSPVGKNPHISVVRTRTETGDELPHPTQDWQRINFADIVFVKSYTEPCEDAGNTSLQLCIPAAFRVNWCPYVGGDSSGCCSSAPERHRIFATAIFVFGTSPLSHYDDLMIDEDEEGEVETGSETKSEPVPQPSPVAAIELGNLNAARHWALRVFERAFPQRFVSLDKKRSSTSIHGTPTVSSSDLTLDHEGLPMPAHTVAVSREVSNTDETGSIDINRLNKMRVGRGKSRRSGAASKYALLSAHRRLLVFINPVGGRKMAVKIYENDVAPLLRHARIEAEVVSTCVFLSKNVVCHPVSLL